MPRRCATTSILKGLRLLVGEAGLPKSSDIKALRKGAGLKACLKRKGYFGRRPHQLIWTVLIATALAFAGWCAPWVIMVPVGLMLLVAAMAIAIVAKINSFGESGSAE
jgi:hypothetical protein